ncbi:MAG: hemerythrin domain-containing protein [Terriglobales bacterium]
MSASDPSPNANGTWAARSLLELTRHIVDTHHRFCREQGAHLSAALADALAAPAPGAALAPLQRQFTQLQATLLLHLTKEEQVLFPMIVRLEQAVNAQEPIPSFAFGSIAAPIRMMDMEHREVERQFAEIRNLAGGFTAPADGSALQREIATRLAAYHEDLVRHTRLEDEILFPRAVALEHAPGSAAP